MSITTYDELKTAVARWLKRDDLTAYIPDYITLAEERIWHGDEGQFPTPALRYFVNESQDSGTSTLGGIVALPSDYLSTLSFYITSGGIKRELRYITPQQYAQKANDSGLPNYYTIKVGSIYMAGTTDCAFTHDYYRPLTALSSSNTSNGLLTSHPGIYLDAACLEGAKDTMNWPLADRFASSLRGKIISLMRTSKDMPAGGSMAVTVGR